MNNFDKPINLMIEEIEKIFDKLYKKVNYLNCYKEYNILDI